MPDTTLTAIGLMSGTSRDGIDAALIVSDGVARVEFGPALTLAYEPEFRARLGAGVARVREAGGRVALPGLEAELTDLHASAVEVLLFEAGLAAHEIDLVGFHGHTMLHRPRRGFTWQLGDAARLAALTGIDVVGDVRLADMAAGGQGAPLAPILHHVLAAGLDSPGPLAILNIGGVANITWTRPGDAPDEGLLAFDCGPGNALLDDWTVRHTGAPCDEGGRLAAAGRVDAAALRALMAHPFLALPPPKSLDRDDFSAEGLEGLPVEDGAATLAAFTIEAVAAGFAHLPEPPAALHVTGGGRHNPLLMRGLGERLDLPVLPVEALGWRGDSLEAELMALLAIRTVRGLPSSFSRTTGVASPTVGGRVYRA